MRVSVITASYNCEATIGDALKSVATQTHPDIEHIVVDGASNDSTVNVVRHIGRRVARLVSEPDSGIYDAMNKGLRIASGDVIGFLNADDMLADANVIADIANVFERDTSISVAFGDLVYVDKDDPSRILRYWRAGDFSRSRLRFGWMPPHPTFYVRSQLIAELGSFSTNLRIAGDYDFMLRCLMRPGLKAAYVRRVVVRMRAGGASNRSLAALLRKSREDLFVLRTHRVGGLFSLACKNLRKLPQFAVGFRDRSGRPHEARR